MARRHDAADRGGDRDRAGRGLDRLIADRHEKAVGRRRQIVGLALLDDDAELVAGEPAEIIAAPHPAAQPPGAGRDHFVADRKPVGLVDPRKIVDRDDQKAKRGAESDRVLKRGVQSLGKAAAVHLVSQIVKARQIGQPLQLRAPFGDHPHGTVCPRRPTVWPGKPAAGVLDP